MSFCLKDDLLLLCVAHQLAHLLLLFFILAHHLRKHALYFLLPSEKQSFVIMSDDLDVSVCAHQTHFSDHPLKPRLFACSITRAIMCVVVGWLELVWICLGSSVAQAPWCTFAMNFVAITVSSLLLICLESFMRSAVVFTRECSKEREHKVSDPLSTGSKLSCQNCAYIEMSGLS